MAKNCVGTYEQYKERLLKMKPNVYLHGKKLDRSNGKEGAERDLLTRLKCLSGYFEDCGIQTEALEQQDIVRLCNLVNNPSYVHLEDTDFTAAIPILESVGVV